MELSVCNIEEYKQLPDICSYCQRKYTKDNPKSTDHIVPQNGQTGVWRSKQLPVSHISNLLICCEDCNKLKRNMSLEEFRAAVVRRTFYNKMGIVIRRIPVNMAKNIINSIDVLLYNQTNHEPFKS